MTSPIRKHRRPRLAFTLVEILAVVVILGIAAALIVPQMGNRDDLRCASMARALMSDLVFAQSRAVSTQTRHYVRFDLANSRYEVLDRMTPTERFVTHPIDRTEFRIPVGAARGDELAEVEFDAVSFDTQPVLMFDELGTPHAYNPDTQSSSPMAAGAIGLKTSGYKLTITVEPYSGELKVN
jgi:prepilin-type N-terminal cleavage/methylation domain-containing protein